MGDKQRELARQLPNIRFERPMPGFSGAREVLNPIDRPIGPNPVFVNGVQIVSGGPKDERPVITLPARDEDDG